jgi:simple sugar transport system ATP-binding protein
VQALCDVDLEIRAGEIHCLAGENGSGKSTLIKILSGVHRPEAGGRLEFFGEAVTGLDPVTAHRLGVQVIWQDLALFAHLSVAENIAFERNLARRPRWVSPAARRRVAAHIVERLGFALPLDRRLGELDIAQRQLVAICRALVADARVVFMDEPTASLTQSEVKHLVDAVRRLQADGIAVVFVSHRLAEVTAIAERVTVLRDGRRVGCFERGEVGPRRLGELMTGTAVEEEPRSGDGAPGPAVIETRGLGRAGEYREVSLTVHAGEVVGLIGLLGAGRTELACSLFGLTAPQTGEIRLDGAPRRFASNADAIAAGVAYVPEDRLRLGLVAPQSIADNVAMSVIRRLAGALGLVDEAAKDALVAGWIERLRIRVGRPQDAAATLSGGNQQRVVLAKWLATEPRLLILDNPTVGVDVGARAGIFAIVRELADAGKAILLISDEVQEVWAHADRVLHMKEGRIVASWRPRETPMATIEAAVHGEVGHGEVGHGEVDHGEVGDG